MQRGGGNPVNRCQVGTIPGDDHTVISGDQGIGRADPGNGVIPLVRPGCYGPPGCAVVMQYRTFSTDGQDVIRSGTADSNQ